MTNIQTSLLSSILKTRKEVIRYFIAGALTNAIDFSIYFLLINVLSYNISKAISFTCAGIVGYLFNKYWAFERCQTSYAEGGRYAFISVLALGINIVTNRSILNIWPEQMLLGLVIASMATGLFTFICFKWWVFRTLLKEVVYFAWWKFFPWRFLIRDAARKQGFLDPFSIAKFCAASRGGSPAGINPFGGCFACPRADQQFGHSAQS